MLLLLTSISFAGTYTDAPGALQGDIAIQNDFLTLKDALYQSEILVGNRIQSSNNTTLLLKMGLLDFMVFESTLPYGVDKVSFSNSQQMKYDPISQQGSYLDTPNIDDQTRKGTGFEGAELSLNFYPFHTKIYSNRGDKGNWQMGLVYRTADKSNFYAVNESGQRGSGVGASGLGIQTGFSNKKQGVEPYLQIKAIKSHTWTGPIRNEDGTVLASNVDFAPSSTVDIQGGTEFFIIDDQALATYVTLDVFGQYRYASFQSIASGTYLPSVLESTKDQLGTQTELVTFQGGIGSNIQLNSLYGFRIAGKMGYASPQRIEHLYEVNTQGSFQWGIFSEIRFRYRTTSS